MSVTQGGIRVSLLNDRLLLVTCLTFIHTSVHSDASPCFTRIDAFPLIVSKKISLYKKITMRKKQEYNVIIWYNSTRD